MFFFQYFIPKLNFQTRLSLTWRKGTSASALVEYQLNNWLSYAQFNHAYASKELCIVDMVNNTIGSENVGKTVEVHLFIFTICTH